MTVYCVFSLTMHDHSTMTILEALFAAEEDAIKYAIIKAENYIQCPLNDVICSADDIIIYSIESWWTKDINVAFLIEKRTVR